jgi:hypothetical protein
MTDDMPASLDLPAVRRKKLTVSFDGGQLSSDGGLLLLREAERRLGIAGRLAGALRDRRDPVRIDHTLPELLKTASSPSLAATRMRTISTVCGMIRC